LDQVYPEFGSFRCQAFRDEVEIGSGSISQPFAECQVLAQSQEECRFTSMQLDYTVQVWEEDGQFIAHAMPLDVASSGSTPEAARSAVDEAVRLFVKTAAEHGTLDEALEDAGYRRVRHEWRGPVWLGSELRTCLAEV
jgi:predicted RNase H-like HicB family nuclease